MRLSKYPLLLLIAACLLMPGTAFGKAKKYQVTGPIISVTDDVIVVQKGDDKWEIDRTADTKVTGELKVGAKVTIEYTMTAAAIENKGAAPAKSK